METNSKEILLESEGDAFFRRNYKGKVLKEVEPSLGTVLFSRFLDQNNIWEGGKILEIGCSFGFNLNFICKKFKMDGYGIDPASEAIAVGKKEFENLKLQVGTADLLDFEADFFDIVLFGFCFYQIDRKNIFDVLSQANKVLKRGGLLVLYDFDTKVPYSRKNKHNDNVPTYKMDLSRLLLDNPEYYLVEKHNYTINEIAFSPDIQERCALQIFYKEKLEDSYVTG